MNFRQLCKITCVVFFLVCVQGNVLAATIHGTVYEWYSFKPLENSIVEINSTPEQSLVATDAEYSFNLTPGTYLITANYFEDNTLVYTAEEEVIVSEEGEYVHDLLLFPTYQEELLDQGNDLETVDLDLEEAEPQSQERSQNTVLIFALFALCILLLAGYFVKKGKRDPPEKATGFPGEMENLNSPGLDTLGSENITIVSKISGYTEPGEVGSIEEVSETNYEPSAPLTVEQRTGDIFETEISVQQNVKLPEESEISINPSVENPSSENPLSEEEFNLLSPASLENPEVSLPEDLKEIMDLIRANGNRITQRELRKKSPYSESKVSLMLSDLEERGLIEKFKRGRGNIIRIPDGEAIKQAASQSKKESGENDTSQ
ncbi:winged helix-turn-helix transcriptional regulator [Methanosarcina sp.]|uniref:helix-turn-helix transcriptional regulator n=1 Tax=Methanosarcina sp. TaxID=2213 RepID=UPI002ABAD2EA|nr:winged helix-turn-helix transcriptional regulator [Methanosarcina sp.]MDY9928123.1 winged helix-turn-helix transcriptional regulator [Methanosarcina sp.]